MAVPRRTASRAPPRTAVRPGIGGRASWHDQRMAIQLGLLPVQSFCLRCTAVQPCCTVVSSTVFLCFAFFDVQGFLEPLIFLEITLEVFLSIETQGFILKRRQNAFEAQCEAKEGNLTLTQLDLT